MKILYVANHGCGGNDDEGAIQYALGTLGHDVILMNEGSWGIHRYVEASEEVDLCLFHKWSNLDALRMMKCPKAFWYFDLVDSGDPTLGRRDVGRKAWMANVIPLVDFGFCTDGDWVEADRNQYGENSKLFWLSQGADERIVGRDRQISPLTPILFTGTGQRGGAKRESWLAEMNKMWPRQFKHITKGVYRERLRKEIAGSAIVVAPDGPVTARYWSNRVYNALGFGAFMIHPWCRIDEQYGDGTELVLYRNREEMHEMIAACLDSPNARQRMSEAALERTKNEHLYRHRLEVLISTITGGSDVAPKPRTG